MTAGHRTGRPVPSSLLVLTIALSLLVRVPLAAQDLILARFGDYVESLRAQAGIPGLAATIVGTNDILWERAFGLQDTERSIAARTDTPFHLDGLTQMLTAALVLRCVEEGRLSLDDRIGQFTPDSPDANATIRQVLSHSIGHRTAGLRLPSGAARAAGPRHQGLHRRLVPRNAREPARPPGHDRLGARSGHHPPGAAPRRHPVPCRRSSATRGVLERLATPYAVDRRGAASPSQSSATTLTPSSGLISTVRDLAQFDLALKKGLLLRPETLATAWRAPLGANRQPLPHGLGWFVQTYKGETIVWQFGVSTERLIVSDGDRAGARDHADPPGEQRRPCQAVRARDWRPDGLAVRAAVPWSLCPVGASAFRSCESVFLVLTILLFSPARTSAEWQIRPFLGVTFGGEHNLCRSG